jgi:integrase
MSLRVATGIMTVSEVGQLLHSASQASLRDHLLLRMLYLTGLRRAEIVEVLVADLLWDLDMIFIRSGKDDKDRYVLLDSQTMAMLRQHTHQKPPETRIFPHTGKWVHDTFLIHGNKSGLIQQYAARGLRLSPHSLRYAFATHLYDYGLHFNTIAELLGHVLPQDTLDYLDTSRLRLEQAYQSCNPFAETPPPQSQAAPRQRPGQAMKAEAYREREREFRSQPLATRNNGLPIFATPDEVKRLLAQAQPPFALLYRTLYVSGMWLEDALAAGRQHFEPKHAQIRLGKQIAFLDPETTDLLAQTAAPTGKLFPIQAAAAQTHFLECAHQTGLAQRLQAAGCQLDLDALRHAFAIHSTANGLDTITLMRLLGHEFYTTTQPLLKAALYRYHDAYRKAIPPALE